MTAVDSCERTGNPMTKQTNDHIRQEASEGVPTVNDEKRTDAETLPCHMCSGTGRLPKPCELCSGNGYVLVYYQGGVYGTSVGGGTLSKPCPNGCQTLAAINRAMAYSVQSVSGRVEEQGAQQ